MGIAGLVPSVSGIAGIPKLLLHILAVILPNAAIAQQCIPIPVVDSMLGPVDRGVIGSQRTDKVPAVLDAGPTVFDVSVA